MQTDTQSVGPTTQNGRARTSRPRALVAEDHAEVRHDLVTALFDAGHDVVGVESGEQLVECLRFMVQESMRLPDLITLDVHMPGRSGLDVLDELRSEGWTMPIVVITAFASDDVWRRVERAGAATVIEKPFDALELGAAARLARMRPASGPRPRRRAAAITTESRGR